MSHRLHDEERSSALWIAAWFAIMGALILFGCVNESRAATYWVRQDSTGVGHATGADSSNCIGIAHLNAIITGGDVALLLGNFTSTPVPQRSGTSYAAPIVYRSAYNDPASVTIRAPFTVNGNSAATMDSFVTWRSLTVRGSVTIGGSSKMGRMVLSNVRVIDDTTYGSGVKFQNVYASRFDSLRVTSTSVVPRILDFGGDWTATDSTRRNLLDTLSNSTFNLANAGGTGDLACYRFSGYSSFYSANVCSVTTTSYNSTRIRFFRYNYTFGGKTTGCTFIGVNNQSGGGIDEPGTFSWKDGVKLHKFWDNRIVISGTSVTTAPFISFAQNETDGNPSFVGEEIGGNSIRNNYVKNLTASQWPIGWTYQGVDGDSIVGNTFVAASDEIYCYYNRGDAVMSTGTVFDHNIFATFGYRKYPFFGQNTAANQSVKFTNNIFWGGRIAAADTNTVRPVYFGAQGSWTADTYGPLTNDYNMACLPLTTTKRGVKWSGGTSSWQGAWSTANGTAQDANSITATASLTDTTLAGFDAHPLAGSASLFGPDGYVGPYNVLGTSYTITASSGTHGSISPSGSVSVASGSSQQFNITPDAGYGIADVVVDGSSVGVEQYQNNQYLFSNVTATHTISATFSATTYYVTASAGSNGSVSPSGAQPYSYGETATVTITPAASYQVLDVVVDGVSEGALTSVSFPAINSNHTVSATFAAAANFNITVTQAAGGTITPGTTSVASGGSQAFTVEAISGWHLTAIIVDGVSVGTSSPYTFSNVTAAHTITATFAMDAASVTLTGSNAGAGWISPSGTVPVAGGSAFNFNVIPAPFRRVRAVYVNGTNVGPVTSYTIPSVSVATQVYATFTDSAGGGRVWMRRR